MTLWYILVPFGLYVHIYAIWSKFKPFGLHLRNLVYIYTIWSIFMPFGIFLLYLVYVLVIWYNFPALVCSTKMNLATLVVMLTQAKTKVKLLARWMRH
jgi:hypothetical protein